MPGVEAEVMWDYHVSGNAMESKELMLMALKCGLAKRDKDKLIETVRLAPELVSEWGFVPDCVPTLIELNHDVALEFFLAIDNNPQKAEYSSSYLLDIMRAC